LWNQKNSLPHQIRRTIKFSEVFLNPIQTRFYHPRGMENRPTKLRRWIAYYIAYYKAAPAVEFAIVAPNDQVLASVLSAFGIGVDQADVWVIRVR